ncbi:LuxR family transcriptional regulator [Verminephrobacter aporrectodeae subsp. tuberculatae]|uniref:response regulator transcription factor n=1 Tax=Verminephrobacter aporrectodeae TaxID=1110389 RepID=UPI002237930C|nr:helix-turn-helix transcriptional regulator [Verminephrobacter aporrectodeae]MCW5221054.1 LuxR family transcriptional regulator [Verminephrobacter aporrectodeae subsp. tuberculatae]MCW5290347.1 LuxR family transcriptional regulator [Verminephrobacter aporrectodeae subsp. tuberculatae]
MPTVVVFGDAQSVLSFTSSSGLENICSAFSNASRDKVSGPMCTRLPAGDIVLCVFDHLDESRMELVANLQSLIGTSHVFVRQEAVPEAETAPPRGERAGLASPALRLQVRLTGRQAQVLNGIREGLSYKVIAARLRISECTVKVHAQALFQQLGVRTRSRAMSLLISANTGDDPWQPSS